MHIPRSSAFPTVAGLILAGALTGALAGPALAAGTTTAQPHADGAAATAKAADPSTSKAGGSPKAESPKDTDKASGEKASSDSKADPKGAASSTVSSAGSVDLSAVPEESVISVDELYEMLGGEELDKAAKVAAAREGTVVLDDELAVIDIRSLAIFSDLHVPGAKCVPAGRVFEIRLREVPNDKTVILIDEDGSRLVETWQTLLDHDYDPEKILVVEGGTDAWFAAEYPTEVTPIRLGC